MKRLLILLLVAATVFLFGCGGSAGPLVDQRGELENVTPGFDVTLDFLDDWLHCDVNAFLINDMLIRLRRWFQDEYGESQLIEYPPTSTTP